MDGDSVVETGLTATGSTVGDEEAPVVAEGAEPGDGAELGVMGENEPEPPCDEPLAPPAFGGLAGEPDVKVIAFAFGTSVANVGAEAVGAIPTTGVVVDGAGAEPPPPERRDDAGAGTVTISSDDKGRGFGATTCAVSLPSARAAITAAGTPIPASRIPSDSVARFRDSSFSNEAIRRASWARRRSVRVGWLMGNASTHGKRNGRKVVDAPEPGGVW